LHLSLPRAFYAGFAGGAPSVLKGGVLDQKQFLIRNGRGLKIIIVA